MFYANNHKSNQYILQKYFLSFVETMNKILAKVENKLAENSSIQQED